MAIVLDHPDRPIGRDCNIADPRAHIPTFRLICGATLADIHPHQRLRRPLAMVAFDPLHARMMGVSPRRMDAALMALVRARPELIPNAVEEVVRLASPIRAFTRFVTEGVINIFESIQIDKKNSEFAMVAMRRFNR